MDGRRLATQPAILSPRSSSRRNLALSPRHLHERSAACQASFAAATRSGELGWQHLHCTEAVDLKLGTLVGAGSYGIVREASLEGAKVRLRAPVTDLDHWARAPSSRVPASQPPGADAAKSSECVTQFSEEVAHPLILGLTNSVAPNA